MPARAERKPPVKAQKKLSAGNATPELNPAWLDAVRAASSKQALDLSALDLRGVTSVSDIFILCTGRNSRQNQAIADEVEQELKKVGERPLSVEGYTGAEWILLDYGDFVVHVFSEKLRAYYDLDRLYRDGKPLKIPANL